VCQTLRIKHIDPQGHYGEDDDALGDTIETGDFTGAECAECGTAIPVAVLLPWTTASAPWVCDGTCPDCLEDAYLAEEQPINTTQCPVCLSKDVIGPDDEGSCDCKTCGIDWDPDHPHNQPGSWAFGHDLSDSAPALFCCAICDRDASTDAGIVIARWSDQWMCTDCLAHRDELIAKGEW
jgi:hypothetical protein